MSKVRQPVRPEKKSIWYNRKTRSITVWAIEIIITLALSAVFAFAFCSSVTIQESSMDPTFQAGNKVLINRTSYVVGRVKRGDLIAYSNSERTDASVHVKRVVGLPGETIQIRDGLILINGQTYIEDREVAAITFGGLAEAGITLGADEYFVLGDNRNANGLRTDQVRDRSACIEAGNCVQSFAGACVYGRGGLWTFNGIRGI